MRINTIRQYTLVVLLLLFPFTNILAQTELIGLGVGVLASMRASSTKKFTKQVIKNEKLFEKGDESKILQGLEKSHKLWSVVKSEGEYEGEVQKVYESYKSQLAKYTDLQTAEMEKAFEENRKNTISDLSDFLYESAQSRIEQNEGIVNSVKRNLSTPIISDLYEYSPFYKKGLSEIKTLNELKDLTKTVADKQNKVYSSINEISSYEGYMMSSERRKIDELENLYNEWLGIFSKPNKKTEEKIEKSKCKYNKIILDKAKSLSDGAKISSDVSSLRKYLTSYETLKGELIDSVCVDVQVISQLDKFSKIIPKKIKDLEVIEEKERLAEEKRQQQQYQNTYTPDSYYTPDNSTHTGPRGGKYHINSKGKKVYESSTRRRKKN